MMTMGSCSYLFTLAVSLVLINSVTGSTGLANNGIEKELNADQDLLISTDTGVQGVPVSV